MVAGHDVWLTPARFIGRFVIYFVIWGFLAWYFRGHSILQDRTGNVRLSKSMERLSAPGMILWAFTITLAAVDLIMSLNPHWSSTMIGVYLFSDAVLSSLVALTLLALWLQSCGLLRGVVTVEHYHDLGKLTFAFVFFWGYIAFSQYMLIWYANMPEETQFYMMRQIGPWAGSLAGPDRRSFRPPLPGPDVQAREAVAAAVRLLADLAVGGPRFRFVLADHAERLLQQDSAGESLPEAFKTILQSPQSVYQLRRDSGGFDRRRQCAAETGGDCHGRRIAGRHGRSFRGQHGVAARNAALVPVKDPRLNESLSFHNT